MCCMGYGWDRDDMLYWLTCETCGIDHKRFLTWDNLIAFRDAHNAANV